MKNILTLIQVGISILLIVAVLLQQQGVGLGSTFGGDGNSFRTKRGLEKGLFYFTIVLSALFMGVGLAIIIVS